MRRALIRSVLVVTLAMVAAQEAAAQGLAIFMDVEGVIGGSLDPQYQDWIDVTAFEQVFLPGERGRIVCQATISKNIDRASPDLWALVSNPTGREVTVDFTVSMSGSQQTYARLELHGAVFRSVSIVSDTATRIAEQIDVTSREVRVAYTEFNVAGQPIGTYEDTVPCSGEALPALTE